MLAFLSFKFARIFGVRPVVVNLVLLHVLIGIGLTAYSGVDKAGLAHPNIMGIFALMYVVLVCGVVGLGRLASRNFFRKPNEWEDV